MWIIIILGFVLAIFLCFLGYAISSDKDWAKNLANSLSIIFPNAGVQKGSQPLGFWGVVFAIIFAIVILVIVCVFL